MPKATAPEDRFRGWPGARNIFEQADYPLWGRRDRESGALLEVGLELIRDAFGELRTLQLDSSPPVPYQEGLEALMERVASCVSQRFGVAMTFMPGRSLPPLGREFDIMLFQYARELVHNLVRHARAPKGSVELDTSEGGVPLVVRDNGQDQPIRRQALENTGLLVVQ